MTTIADIRWFKNSFGPRIVERMTGTPFDVDMLTALACQETGELWAAMRHEPGLTPDAIAALCCGDTLDADKGRAAFPRTKADLVAKTVVGGEEMFKIARKALLAMAEYVPAYRFARRNEKKFCHGFGVFQYDLQFFLTNPKYFLERQYEIFENSLDRALVELKAGLKKRKLEDRAEISDMEFCHVAICYNTGGFDPSRGLKQGHKSDGLYYGEAIRDHLALVRKASAPAIAPAASIETPPGPVLLPEAATSKALGPWLRVDVTQKPLRLRSAPAISSPPEANVKATIPDGQPVRAVTGTPVNGFMEIEVVLGGQLFRGFASTTFLVPEPSETVAGATLVPDLEPALAGLPEAHLIEVPNLITRRTDVATARSLNEKGLPGRGGVGPAQLRKELAGIIDYLDTERQVHKRYWPRDGLTFCNIYAHDYCRLANAYLPRVWWTSKALVQIASGRAVEPRLGASVREQRANDLFHWLQDFGTGFGWRRALTLDELQAHANLGGIAIIVARRRDDGRSGHIVAVVPETETQTAKRDTAGRVELPLQSQAGVANFRYGRSTRDWWKHERFAEAAFWIHA